MSIKDEIQSICIQNIKGYGSNCENNRLKFSDSNGTGLLPNKINILVGHNGFGKSSFAVALDQLNYRAKTLNIAKKDLYFNHDENLESSIKIDCKLDGISDKLIANKDQNDIRSNFDIFVINSKLEGKGNMFGQSTGELNIKPLVITKVKPKVDIGYKYRVIQKQIRELLDNDSLRIDNLNNTSYLTNIKIINSILPICEKYNGRNKKTFLDNINNQIDNEKLKKLKSDFFYESSDHDFNVTILQFILLFETIRKKEFHRYTKYLNYIQIKKFLQETIKTLKTFKHDIKVKETQGELRVELPKLSLISNGQRDVMVFISQLFKFLEFTQSKKDYSLLIIDEVFDYLDDANLLVAHYYLVKFINEVKELNKKVFPMLLTHLDPLYFTNHSFKRPKIFYLTNSQPRVNKDIRNIIRKRKDIESCNSKFAQFLHYCREDNLDLQTELGSIFNSSSIDSKLAKRDNFIDTIAKEFDNYKKQITYCPISVALYLRIVIEKYGYSLLSEDIQKEEYINTYKTIDKLYYVEDKDKDKEIDECFYLLSPIYNEMAHKSTSTLYSKLENKTIRKIILDIYDKVKHI